jgi:hypothetical protein
MLPYQRHQKASQQQRQQQKSSFDILLNKTFWIWNKQEHLKLAQETNQQCCFNHIVGLPQKGGIAYPLFDYEKLLYDALMSTDGSFKDKHLWVKKATGLGVTEFMLRIMAWLCTIDNGMVSNGNSQMCIVTGPNIDIAIKLIRRLKNIFERKLGLIFTNKETVLELNGCRIEAFPSNHLDAYRALENPQFILLDESDFWRKGEVEDVRHLSERYIGISDIGLLVPDNLNGFQLQFLNDVDVRKMPIQRTVTTMTRIRAPDYSDESKAPKYETKEWIYYKEEWEGRNMFDVPIFMRNEHYEGVYTKRFLKPELNELTGEMENVLDRNKSQLIYYIPWSKKNVDEIIGKSAKTDKNSIKFIIKFSRQDSIALGYNPRIDTHSTFPYEKFAEWDWKDVYYFHVAPNGNYWDPKAKSYKTIGAQIPVQSSHIA